MLFILHYIFLRLAKQSQFIPLQNVVYFITLHFLVCKIFTFYINDVLLFKCPVPGPKVQLKFISILSSQHSVGLPCNNGLKFFHRHFLLNARCKQQTYFSMRDDYLFHCFVFSYKDRRRLPRMCRSGSSKKPF